MIDEDLVFKALADTSRRFLLDLLHKRDGQTLGELEWELEMTRFGVMKHLKVLEEAGLIITRREGREKLHFLNAVPIRLIHDRWIDKYKEREVSALADLKNILEKTKCPDGKKDSVTHVHPQIYIKAEPAVDLGCDHRPEVEWQVRLPAVQPLRAQARRQVPRIANDR